MKLAKSSVFSSILLLVICALPVWAGNSNNSYDERFILKEKKNYN